MRITPRRGGDVMDVALAGRIGVIESIDITTDDEPHFGVTVDNDPGREFGVGRYPGHRFFFRADEIEPIADAAAPHARILIAGIGNIFFSDDGFGAAVARRLAERDVPLGVTVRDFGIRGLDLAYALQDGYDAVVFVDAMPHGAEPGALCVVEPSADDTQAIGVSVDAHGMDPVRVLRLARSMGRVPPRIFVVGCEPATITPSEVLDDGLVALSPPVASAVDAALELVSSLIAEQSPAISH
ncbi:MAG TPA: hydrogenase maturation protease [Gemmatimonadaceae bacterium]